MPTLAAMPKTFVVEVLTPTDLNAAFAHIRSGVNASALFKDVTSQTVNVAVSWTATQTFTPASGVAINVTAGGMTVAGGKSTLAATVAGYASLNLPHGTAPSAPANGDVWTTTAGFYTRINGATTGPYATGTGTSGKVAKWSGANTIADGSLSDDGTYLTHATQPRCFLSASTGTAVGVGATVAIAFADADTIDVGSMHDPATNNTRVTVPASAGGLYLVWASSWGTASTAGTLTCDLQKNGTTSLINVGGAPVVNPAASGFTISAFAFAVLAAADYVEFKVTNDTTGSITVRSGLGMLRLW